MSTPPAAISLGNTVAYREGLIARLGGRERFQILHSTGDEIRRLIGPQKDAALRTRPFEGKWTPVEILGHLVDAEILFALRTRTILCDRNPRFVPIDQNRWVAAQKHKERSAADLLEEFGALRAMNLRLWRSLSAKELLRSAMHPERGEESLDEMITMLAGHDLSHLDQLERYLKAIDPRS